MKKIIITLIITLFGLQSGIAQVAKNNSADNIVGTYEGVQEGYKFRAKIEKSAPSTYRAQVIWMEHDRDANGHKLLDSKNPDKALRSTPCDRIELISGLTYDAKKQHWSGAKIYDPLRGIRANVRCWFQNESELHLRGSLLGISETVVWKKIK
ncbi:MAG: DUF2147 domain-containing protein [Bacteroidales bacterium]|nr:DUF2147 domain-containing protein [Bacteroidales bacterium]